MSRPKVLVLGGGPAGLGAAYRLAQRDAFDIVVLEQADRVGGNAGSFEIDGLRVDYGSHRLHPACPPEVLADIRDLLGDDLLERPRHGRIRLAGRWIHFPLRALDLAWNAPPRFALGVLRDLLRRGAPPPEDEATFETVLESQLGRTLCDEFYFPYAVKLWGVEPAALDAEQARRRVSVGSVGRLLGRVLSSLAGRSKRRRPHFFYPRRGYGQISEAYRSAAERAGAKILLSHRVSRLETTGTRLVGVEATSGQRTVRFDADTVVSTIPLPALISATDPPPNDDVLAARDALRYRAMLLIYLVLDTDRFSEFDAHYFPATTISISRLSEPKNYGLAESPGTTVLCAELPCGTDEAVWEASDEALGALATEALERADLRLRHPVRRVVTRRLSHAYPIYERGYASRLERLERWVDGIDGLLTIGRQGLFAHDNTHHTLAMGYAAADALDDDGRLDGNAWARARREFEQHVVED